VTGDKQEGGAAAGGGRILCGPWRPLRFPPSSRFRTGKAVGSAHPTAAAPAMSPAKSRLQGHNAKPKKLRVLRASAVEKHLFA